jgi:hypothetical protein
LIAARFAATFRGRHRVDSARVVAPFDNNPESDASRLARPRDGHNASARRIAFDVALLATAQNVRRIGRRLFT